MDTNEIGQAKLEYLKKDLEMVRYVYVVRDRRAVEIIETGNLDGFAAYVKENPTLDFGKEEFFWTKEAAEAFCRGLAYGVDERTGMAPYPLKGWERPDSWFMQLISRPDDLEKIKKFIKTLEEEKTSNRLFVVYGLKNHEVGAALVEEDLEGFREMVENGEAGEILKGICTSRESANRMSSFLATNHDCILLSDYEDEGDKAYVEILEEKKCYCVWEDETVEEEDE